MKRALIVTAMIAASVSLSACAETTVFGPNPFNTTSALPPKPKVDPACAALSSRIQELRGDGIIDRVEAASKGKSKTVSVKRDSLSRMAELEKANADFQAKCSVMSPGASQAARASGAASQAKVAADARTAAAAVRSVSD